MRVNSISLRLNHSSSWSNTVAPGRSYSDHLSSLHVETIRIMKSLLVQEPFVHKLILGNVYTRVVGKGRVCVDAYMYLPELVDSLQTKRKNHRPKKRRRGLLHRLESTLDISSYRTLLSGFSAIFSASVSRIFPPRTSQLRFVLVRRRFFNSYIVSKYITSRLKHMFRLNKVANDIVKDLSLNKGFSDVMIYCSGRFDRKERASFYMFAKGKISPNTISNRISFSCREVILKYGICGIKVWTLKR